MPLGWACWGIWASALGGRAHRGLRGRLQGCSPPGLVCHQASVLSQPAPVHSSSLGGSRPLLLVALIFLWPHTGPQGLACTPAIHRAKGAPRAAPHHWQSPRWAIAPGLPQQKDPVPLCCGVQLGASRPRPPAGGPWEPRRLTREGDPPVSACVSPGVAVSLHLSVSFHFFHPHHRLRISRRQPSAPSLGEAGPSQGFQSFSPHLVG